MGAAVVSSREFASDTANSLKICMQSLRISLASAHAFVTPEAKLVARRSDSAHLRFLPASFPDMLSALV